MRLTVVGCSGSLAGPDSPASCYLVEHDGFRLVLDLGSGAMGPLQRHVAPHEVDAVLLSHLHPDHCIDLCGLYVARRYGPVRPASRVAVIGPRGVAARIRAAYGPTGDETTEVDEHAGVGAELAFAEVGTAPWTLGPFRITAYAVTHPVEAYAYRIEAAGRTLAYSGDCAPCPGVSAAMAGADLALVEAAFVERPDNPPGTHHTGRDAGELARSAGVGRLLVTHVPPWYDPQDAAAASRAVFDGQVEPARAGVSYDL